MIETIKAFVARIVNLRFEGDAFFIDPYHRVEIVALGNGNARFDYSTLIGATWELLSTLELEVGRNFWAGVVQVIRSRVGVNFILPDRLVAGAIVATLPGADVFLQDKPPAEKAAPPKKKPIAKVATTTKRA